MARYCGEIGYAETNVETAPGVWEDVIKERTYFGDVLRISRQLETVTDKVNGDISIGNSFSIVADAYAYENFFAMRYIKWMGTYWAVTNVEVQRPRLILSVGGVYNGDKA